MCMLKNRVRATPPNSFPPRRNSTSEFPAQGRVDRAERVDAVPQKASWERGRKNPLKFAHSVPRTSKPSKTQTDPQRVL